MKNTVTCNNTIKLPDSCWMSVDFAPTFVKDFRKTKGAEISGSFDYFNPKTKAVETVYIQKILYNNPVVVVFWSDGTKTKAKARKNDMYDEEVGVLYCILKKLQPTINLDMLFTDWFPTQYTFLNTPTYVTLKDVRDRYYRK